MRETFWSQPLFILSMNILFILNLVKTTLFVSPMHENAMKRTELHPNSHPVSFFLAPAPKCTHWFALIMV